MAGKTALHALIRSLSQAEKRYFKLFAGMGAGRSQSNYLLLFDCLNAMEVFDENALRSQLSGQPFLNHLPSTIHRLYALLLKSLRTLHDTDSIDAKLRTMDFEIEVLLAKQQFREARRIIGRAKALAREYEREGMLLALLDCEKRMFLLAPEGDGEAFHAVMAREEEAAMSRFVRQRRLLALHERVRNLARTASPGELADLPELNALQKEVPGGLICSVYWHNIQGIALLNALDYFAAHRLYQNLMALWEEQAHRIPDQADLYLGCANNYLNACLFGLEHIEFLSSAQSLRSLDNLPAAASLKLRRIVYSHELNYSINFGKYDEGVQLVAEIENWLRESEQQLDVSRRLAFYYNIANFHFGFGQVSEANRWINRILNLPRGPERPDIRDFARLFQLVIQYELGHLDLQEYFLRSSYRYFARSRKLTEFEAALIDFMKEMGKVPEQSPAFFAACEQLHTQLDAMWMDKWEKAPLGLELTLFWVKSKLKRVPFREHFEYMIEVNLQRARAKYQEKMGKN